jgi:FkbM family methyltransferase
MNASYDGFSYKLSDPVFVWHVNNGKCEPYPVQIPVIEKFLQLNPDRNRVCIDIGAHCGTTILPFSKYFHKVVGYEPNRDNYELCATNIELNQEKIKSHFSSCEVRNFAVSDKPISGKMVLHGVNSGCYYLQESPEGDVKTVRLDNETYSSDGEYNTFGVIDFIKIDTEGAELSVLKSAENTLKKWKPFLIFENNGLSDKHFGVSKKEIIDYVESLGYVPFRECKEAIEDVSNSYYW